MNQEKTIKRDHDTYQALLDIIRRSSNPQIDSVNEQDTFAQNGVDSIQLVEIIITIESEFGIDLYDEDIDTLNTPSLLLDHVLDVIKKKQNCAA